MTTSYDVVVIGAGLSGLAATQRLSAAGKRVALVEARARFGGRVWTRHDPGVDVPIEMGPEWFDESGPVHSLLTAAGAESVEAQGHHFRRVGSVLRAIDEDADGGDELHRRLESLGGADRSVADAIREVAGPELHGHAEMLRHYIEGFHAADPNRLSLQWFHAVEQNQPADASELRARQGLDGALQALLTSIGASATVYLDTRVGAVRWRPGHAAVDCSSRSSSGTLTAPAVVVTLPLGVLALAEGDEGAVRFEPPLAQKAPAIELLATGPVIKLALVFDRPFWRDLPQLADTLFLQDFSQPIPTWWTTHPVNSPMLTGWAAGPQAARVGPTDPTTLRHTAVRSLAHALQVTPAVVDERLRHIHHHDWQGDPYARGAYTWVPTGGVDAHRVLAEPLDRTLFFAGEATCGDGYNATMDGAIQSGWRVAAEVLDRR